MRASGEQSADLLSGIALGLFTGLLLGLSIHAVVASVVGAIAAVLAGFFGLSQSTERARHLSGRRIAAFGFAAVFGVCAGIYARANDLASPAVGAQVQSLVAAGYSASDAREIVAYHVYGLAPKGLVVARSPETARPQSTGLFAGSAIGDCNRFAPGRFGDITFRLDAMRSGGEKWQALAAATAPVPAAQREPLLDAAWKLACE